MILCDTSVIIDVVRQHPPTLSWARGLGVPAALPGFVKLEVLAGCRSNRERVLMTKLLEPYPSYWPSEPALEAGLPIFGRLRLSHGIKLMDALIAVTAVEHRLPLYTFDVSHFSIWPGLTVVRPYPAGDGGEP